MPDRAMPSAPRRRPRLRAPLCTAWLAAPLAAQATVLSVHPNTEANLTAAIQAANAMAFATSAANPVVVELAHPAVGGGTIALTQALPVLIVDHVTVRVSGAGPATRVVIDASNAPTAFRLSSRHAELRNVRFQNAGAPGTQQDVFSAVGTEDLVLRDCDFDGATGNALWLIGAQSTTVQSCGFHGSAGGLVATGGTSALSVVGCTFTGNGQGVLLAVGEDVTVRDCTFDGNASAMVLQPICADVTFGPNNLVRNSTAGAAVVASGAVRLRVLGSRFADNERIALQLTNLCADVLVEDTVFERNGLVNDVFQLAADGCALVRLRGVLCRDGGAGATIAASSSVEVVRSPLAPTSLTGNRREALVVRDCDGVRLDGIAAAGNLTAVGGAQVALLGGRGVDVTDAQIGAATGAGRIGLRIDGTAEVRVGGGTSVLDNGGQGVLVDGADGVVLGHWAGALGGLSVRGPAPLQVVDSTGVAVVGSASHPCSLQGGAVPAAIGCSVSGGAGARFGPHVVVDGGLTTAVAMQVADAPGVRLVDVELRGHTQRGLVAVRAPGLIVQQCTVDGGAASATGEGMLVNPDCHGALLLGNLVRGQMSAAFKVVDCDGVRLGPGNRAIDNGGDGFVVWDTGTGPATRHATIQSAVAVGRGLASQSGFRCVRMRANLTNVTATANGTGVLLQGGAAATVVNAISWGNGVDRNREPASTGAFWNGLYATTAGNGSPGAWTQLGTIAADPLFVSAATGDVRLQAGSPAIDTGLHATPVGAALPSADALLADRIRGGTIDRGAVEFVPAGGTGNVLDVTGPWLRAPSDHELTFTVRGTTAQAGRAFLLAVSGSGTGPALAVAGGMPLVPDALSATLLSIPAWSVGTLGPGGVGTITLPLPAFVVPWLPEMTFAAAIDVQPPASNPVVVRFLP